MHDITQPPDATPSESTESDGGTTPEVSRKVRKHHKRSRSKNIAPPRQTKKEQHQAAQLQVIYEADPPQ